MVIDLSDEDLDKEIAFAEAFEFSDPDAQSWLDALKAEKARRSNNDRKETL